MVRHAIFAVAVALAGFTIVPSSFAQSPQTASPKRESLAERIQRLREAETDAAGDIAPREVQRNQDGSLRTVMRGPIEQRASTPTVSGPALAAPAVTGPALNGPAVITPDEMEASPVVSSRRGFEPSPITEVEPLEPMPELVAAPESSEVLPERSPGIFKEGALQERLSELRDVITGRPAPRMATRPASPRPVGPRPTFDAMEVEPAPATRPMVIETAPTTARALPARAGALPMSKEVGPTQPWENTPPLTSSRRTAKQPTPERVAVSPQSQPVMPDAENESILLTVEGPQLQARTLGPNRLVVGRPAEFTVMISNDGDASAEDVVVSVQLPPGVDVEGTNASRGKAQLLDSTKSEQSVNWRIDRLPAEESETVVLRLIPRTSNPFELQVRYTYAQSSSKVHVEVEEPMLNMVISGPSETVYGQTKVFILTVSNPGTGDAENVMLSLLPLSDESGVTDSHPLGTLRRGETKTVPVELTAARAGSLMVRARATADGGLTAEANKDVLVRRAELDVVAQGPQAMYAGNPARYRVRVSNIGNAAAEKLTLSALLPTEAEFTTASENGKFDTRSREVRWQLASLQPGDAVELEVECVLTGDGANTLRVTAVDSTELTADAVATTNVIARADLKLTVSDPAGPVNMSEEGLYEIRIKNRGTKTAKEVEVVAFFSEGIEPVSVQGGTHQIGQGQVLFLPIPKVEPGEEVVLQVRAKAQIDGNHTFRAEVACQELGSRLVAQETTHYYGEDFAHTAMRPNRVTPQPAGPQPTELQPVQEPTELKPSDDRYGTDNRYPTPAEPTPIEPLRR